jgi:2-oxoglutarate ferredoxin oxidoreductase subunit gamma
MSQGPLGDRSRIEVRVTGFGGQGVVLAGHIIGRACAIHGGKHATLIQSFGPEARGSACSATLAISDTEVLYPYISRPDILVVMSSEGYEKYRDELKPKGTLVYEQDLVLPRPKTESLGRSIVQNIVMVGFFTGVTNLVPRDAMREAVAGSVPAGTEELNLKAFASGLEFADGAVKQPALHLTRPPAEGVTT